MLDLSDIERRIKRAQETIDEIQKGGDDNNCDEGDQDDLAEAKKELTQARKDKTAKHQALVDAIQAALQAAIDLGKNRARQRTKHVPTVEKAVKEGKVDAEEELDGLKTALAESAKRARQAVENFKQHQQLAEADQPAVRPPTGKQTFVAQAAVVLKVEREIKDLMKAASGQGEGESDPQEMDPETLKLLMEMMRMLQAQGLMPDSPPSQSQSPGSGPPSQGSGQGQSPGQSNSGGTTNRDNPIDGDQFNRNDPNRDTPQASGANGRVPSEYQDKIQAYLRALRANQKKKN